MTTRDETYWNAKFEAYVHDPFDKVFWIPGHEERAEKIRAAFGLHGQIVSEYWKKADGMAAGLQRGQVPSHDSDKTKDGSVDYVNKPVLTHCLADMTGLDIGLSSHGTDTTAYAAQVNQNLVEYLKKRIGDDASGGGISNLKRYKKKPEVFAIGRFFYTHLLLRGDLADNNIAGLGALWHRIPADSRFPDHSIWQHAALTSAFNTCLSLPEGGKPGLMVFSITPVQAFIARARKLRDFWTGSVLLSWLAFEGIRWVIENLGPDHVIYPSLVDQPLVLRYLEREWDLEPDRPAGAKNRRKNDDIASFPNKFVVLVPMNHVQEIATGVTTAIRQAWKDLTAKTHAHLSDALGAVLTAEANDYLKTVFARQNEHFWDIQWAANALVSEDDETTIARLLPKGVHENPFKVHDLFKDIIEELEERNRKQDKPKKYDKSGTGTLYAVSHALCQSALAATKAFRPVRRMEEPGQKCHLCGEFEVLHLPYTQGQSAAFYKRNCVNAFWEALRAAWPSAADFRDNEALCSVCLTKRLAYSVIGNDKHHSLYHAFRDGTSFPSTTEMALTDFWDSLPTGIRDELARNGISRGDLAQYIHQADAEMPDQEDAETDMNKAQAIKNILTKNKRSPADRDRYYAVLVMDGDKMGELVNGKRITATWASAMHADIVERLRRDDFDKIYRDSWRELFPMQRLLTPDIHAAISEALGDFALHGVGRIIEEARGRLIYAGGDDVCAVLPLSTALPAARKIREYYRAGFKFISTDGTVEDVGQSFSCKPGKLSLHMGKACTISAGILICHHKEPLSGMIKQAEYLLNKFAKGECDRDACAIELRKRSGGSRFFLAKWDETNAFNQENIWESFTALWLDEAMHEKAIGKSLLYRFDSLREGFQAVIDAPGNDFIERAVKLVTFQAKRTLGIKAEKDAERLEKVSKRLAGLIFEHTPQAKPCFKPERLIVSEYLCAKEDRP